METAASGRPRLYCSARCRQRAYRQRSRTSADDDGGTIAMASHLRDNANRLWSLVNGWRPPPGDRGAQSIHDLAGAIARLATRLADLHQLHVPSPRSGNETRDETPCATHHPPEGCRRVGGAALSEEAAGKGQP